MFEDWKEQVTDYVLRRLDRKPFRGIEGELNADVAELSELYLTILTENGVIDANGDDTDMDFDEDDLLEAMLDRFLEQHACNDESAVRYAALIDAYLALVEELSEDL